MLFSTNSNVLYITKFAILLIAIKSVAHFSAGAHIIVVYFVSQLPSIPFLEKRVDTFMTVIKPVNNDRTHF